MSGISEPTNNIVPAAGENEARSTEGMTTKVVKGSIWTLAGQVLPMMVALIATPFTIRFLGSEGYGVLILVGLIPTYFSFADFGMGIASTKFGSEAYGEQNPEKKARSFAPRPSSPFASLLFAVPIFLFSWPIVTAFNVPEHFQTAASIGPKDYISVIRAWRRGSVVNTPMLARLRMDLNTATNAVPKILMAVITPFVLYFGAGVLGAVYVSLVTTLLGISGILFFSARLLPALLGFSINRNYVGRLTKYGGVWLIAMIATALLSNLEKLTLSHLVSVTALAHYSVAFTFANVATLFSQAMILSLIPAFSQLTAANKREAFDNLFARGIRIAMILLLPTIMLLFVLGRPFLTLWAGEEFGRESTYPFYILLLGLLFSIISFIPYSALLAVGRTDVFAKIYWVELFLYAILAVVLIGRFQAIGPAAAYSLRIIF
ncbi:MAG: oligosaccharide flippase family protein [Acidobacteria bacterium]|nr:oligosaccharide flippase family protein [Acidobacteriota bacterium]